MVNLHNRSLKGGYIPGQNSKRRRDKMNRLSKQRKIMEQKVRKNSAARRMMRMQRGGDVDIDLYTTFMKCPKVFKWYVNSTETYEECNGGHIGFYPSPTNPDKLLMKTISEEDVKALEEKGIQSITIIDFLREKYYNTEDAEASKLDTAEISFDALIFYECLDSLTYKLGTDGKRESECDKLYLATNLYLGEYRMEPFFVGVDTIERMLKGEFTDEEKEEGGRPKVNEGDNEDKKNRFWKRAFGNGKRGQSLEHHMVCWTGCYKHSRQSVCR